MTPSFEKGDRVWLNELWWEASSKQRVVSRSSERKYEPERGEVGTVQVTPRGISVIIVWDKDEKRRRTFFADVWLEKASGIV